MEWATKHGMLFGRKVIAFDLYKYKPGSKERGQCRDRIAESLISLLKLYAEKRNKKMRASEAKVEHTEFDDLLLDTQKRQQQAEVEAAEASEANNKKLDKKRQEKKLDGYQWMVYQEHRKEEEI